MRRNGIRLGCFGLGTGSCRQSRCGSRIGNFIGDFHFTGPCSNAEYAAFGTFQQLHGDILQFQTQLSQSGLDCRVEIFPGCNEFFSIAYSSVSFETLR